MTFISGKELFLTSLFLPKENSGNLVDEKLRKFVENIFNSTVTASHNIARACSIILYPLYRLLLSILTEMFLDSGLY